MDSKPVHDSQMKPPALSRPPLWLLFAWTSICTLWIWSGLWKALGWSAFTETVKAHNVLPNIIVPLLPAVPLIEICLGAGGLACFPSSRPQSRTILVPLASLLALAGLTVYLALVPADLIRNVGCGCHGASIRASIAHFGFGSKTHFLAFNLSLLGAHLPVLGRAGISARLATG